MCKYSSVGFQHRIVDEFLIFSELAISWIGACDVRRVAVVLASHVQETETQTARSSEGQKTNFYWETNKWKVIELRISSQQRKNMHM